ncbi:hypothetical protein FA15DRAFT_201908 [Coprinopsis marcescibilis]|uniref:Hydrophobin n=1 Tax=Coprinopsis marcescibilis TaxID=230819 RepID=A0A5C3LN81_COPMA|nr:hypothetical protein FA15DRAFT_201908 [Coprinopsis marcescibilis]
MGLFGVSLNSGEVLGLGCSSITGIGASGDACSAQPVCCHDNAFTAGVLRIGCIPLNIVL